MAVSPFASAEQNFELAMCPSYAPMPDGSVVLIAALNPICKGCGNILVEDGPAVCPRTFTGLMWRMDHPGEDLL